MEQTQVRPRDKVVITRIFDAPRERVWEAWTIPEQAREWWGPKGYTAPVIRIDLRVGGEFFNCMSRPDEKPVCGIGTFKEIKTLERFVVTDSFADEQGKIVPATYYGMSPDWPREALITVTFEKLGGKTRLTLTYSGIRGVSEADLQGMSKGWDEMFDKLEAYLSQK